MTSAALIGLAAGYRLIGHGHDRHDDIAATDRTMGRICQLGLGFELRLLCHATDQVQVRYAALVIEVPIPLQWQKAAGAGNAAGGCQGLLEGEMLKTMQGIVVYEVPDGCLTGEQMLQVINSLSDLLPDIAALAVALIHNTDPMMRIDSRVVQRRHSPDRVQG